MRTDDGGPAFPAKPALWTKAAGEEVRMIAGEGGMSLRDYFAAAALPAAMKVWPENRGMASKRAYEHADAMLAARRAGLAESRGPC